MLRIENVSKAYGDKVAIKNISFEVPKQTTFGLLGPNGAGKTTLIRIINQILQADEGHIFLNDEKIQPKHIGMIGYMPEERGLYKKMKVGEQLLYLARLKGMSKSLALERIKWWFNQLEMIDWWDKKVESLSKGMQQKVQFIATVIHNPSLIILDEPFSGFDPVNAEAIKDELLRLRDEKGATIMLSTHRMESVEELCSHMAMIHLSDLKLKGSIVDVKNQFKSGVFSLTTHTEINLHELDNLAEAKQLELDEYSGLFTYELKLNEGIVGNDVLQKVIGLAQINSFSEKMPTIEEIFVKIAKAEA